MLLSMSKQFFAAQVFTHSTLNSGCILTSSPYEGISYLLLFQRAAKFCLTSPAMDGLPVGLSHLGFSVGTEGNLNKPDRREQAKIPPPCSQFFLTRVSPISP